MRDSLRPKRNNSFLSAKSLKNCRSNLLERRKIRNFSSFRKQRDSKARQKREEEKEEEKEEEEVEMQIKPKLGQ